MITAPFNFVPLSEKVFFPDWSKQVSHDVPFEDAQSGSIDITITAKSPIFIRDHEKEREFCQHNGEYYIPGTSVKGMVRNVLEIMSFSKLNFFDDNTYAFRDLNNKEHYMSKMKPTNTFCGWLTKEKEKLHIEDCGIPGRIRLDKIGDEYYSRFYDNFLEKEDSHKTSEFKYNLFDDLELPTHFSHKKNDKNDNGKDIYVLGDEKEGKIVFTGQPSARVEGVEPSGKIYEFIFFESQKKIEIEEHIFENFKFAYFHGRKTQPKESLDWTFWKNELESGGKIPIFFQKGKDGKIVHFGLSYLYKLPYNYSIKNAVETISKEQISEEPDLAQTIFGHIDKENQVSLKGRVQFSHFRANAKPKKFKTITTVLGSPRASYYPIYMQQNYEVGDIMVEDGRYNTLMDKKTKIAGRKRYPLHQKIPNPKAYKKSVDSATTFNPLGDYDKESKEFNEFTFSGKMRYHNLRKSELGALLSALTFHGNSDKFYHSIGMGKSLGFGKIKIDIAIDANKQLEVLQEYEELMQEQLDAQWLDTTQINELFAMANKDLPIDHHLEYLVLDPAKGQDDFREKKSQREYLPLVTDISKMKIRISSILDPDTINAFLEQEKKKQKILEKEKAEMLAKNALIETTPDAFSSEFKDAIKKYVTSNIELPFFDYSDLKKVFEEREAEIYADDVYDAYMLLIEKESFASIENLLLKREKGKATEIELAKLYRLLTENTNA